MTFHSPEMRGLATRRLSYAIVASLLGHLLIFWPASLRVLSKDTPSVLEARLHAPLSPRTGPATFKPPSRAVPPAPTIASPPPLPEPAAAGHSGSLPAAQTEPVPADAGLKIRAETGSAAVQPAAIAPAATGVVSAALLTEANASGETADGLRGYRLALASQARRFKRYPAQAMASGWTGSVDIRVEVAADGRPRSAVVARSSGHEPLDRAALAMIDAGAQRARSPESLLGKAFAVVLPVVFNLDDE